MQVLSNIADKAVTLIDRTAGAWLVRLGETPSGRAGKVAALRKLVLSGLVAMVAVPAGLSMLVGPAIALPAGVALVLALFLVSAVLFLTVPGLKAAATTGVSVATPVATVAPGSLRSMSFMGANIPGMLLMMDEHGLVIDISGRDRMLFPLVLRNCAGQALAELVHVSDRIHFVRALDALRMGEASSGTELRFERPPLLPEQGQFFHCHIDMTAMRDDDGRIRYIAGHLRDISTEQTLRDEVSVLNGEVEAANEAKSRFLAAVSHELRTPLNAILGFSDILAGEYFGRLENDRQREYVQLIRQSGGHLLSVVNTMLDMSKLETGRYELMMEPFAISEAVEACEAMLGLQAREKGVTLTSRVQRNIGEVVADQRALKQVLINLAGNAIKFTDAGGVVSIDAGVEGARLVLSVSDTGIGIAPEKITMLGQPFMQVQNEHNRRYEGTGLGLSLVKGLVALHGGTFAITSRPGEGTMVTIAVPLDGSGATAAQDGPDASMVEFPPRLRERPSAAGRMEEDNEHGCAKAKIA